MDSGHDQIYDNEPWSIQRVIATKRDKKDQDSKFQVKEPVWPVHLNPTDRNGVITLNYVS